MKLYIMILNLTLFAKIRSHLFQENFDSDNYQKSFSKQCSYVDIGCKNHYQINTLQGSKRLKISIFSSDKPFKRDTPTQPRSELRMNTLSIMPKVDYVVTWKVHISQYIAPYEFCFFQVFADSKTSGPNIMIKWKRNQYELWVERNKQGRYRTNLIGRLNEDVNQTTTWKISLRMDRNNGYVKVERKRESDSTFIILGQMKGQTAETDQDIHHIKLGIYSQTSEVKNMVMWISNLSVN